MNGQEIGHRLDTHRQPPRREGMRDDLWKQTAGVSPRTDIWGPSIRQETRSLQPRFPSLACRQGE